MTRTLIIAEAGVNHNGDIDLAYQLVEAALKAGADIVKFQSFQAVHLATHQAEKSNYQKNNTDERESQLAMLKKLELTYEQHIKLINYCKQRGILFLSSAFDLPSIDLLSTFNLNYWKIPSGEITNLPYLRKVGSLNKPIFLSTGMSNLGEVERAIDALEAAGTPRDQITVLQCTTEYPAPLDDVNLRAMQSMSQAFGVAVGYSDHTEGIYVPVAAVAMGATVIEKHLTLNRNMAGPDHKASLEPEQFREMVSTIRSIERATGNGIKKPTETELINLPIARKSLVASRPINAGEEFTQNNLTAKRPGTGISPMRIDDLLGRVARRSFAKDELIDL